MAQVLDQVLGSRGCQWSRKGNIIMVTRKESIVQGYRLLKGYVKDEEGEAVIGAFVKVEGTDIQTVTDADGYYQIKVPASQSKVTYGYLGMDTASYMTVCAAG